MKLSSIVRDDDAVSPVIGVILMVAITVILAAVIGTFVLGLGDQVQSTAPQAQFTFSFSDNSAGTADELTIAHDGGDAIDASRISITTSGATAGDGDGFGSDPYSVTVRDAQNQWSEIDSAGDVSAGSSITIGSDEFEDGSSNTLPQNSDSGAGSATQEQVILDGATVRVVWTNQDEKNSATLGKWTGPDA